MFPWFSRPRDLRRNDEGADPNNEEESLRTQFTRTLGFDPSQSWSYSGHASSSSANDEEAKRTAGTTRNTRSPQQGPKVQIDDKGNYVVNDREASGPRHDSGQPNNNITREMFDQWSQWRIKESQNLQCSVCQEVVLRSENLSERKFGLLPDCSHILCLRCILNWRKRRTCPICRTKFQDIIPCKFYVSCKKEKQRMVRKMIALQGPEFARRRTYSPEVSIESTLSYWPSSDSEESYPDHFADLNDRDIRDWNLPDSDSEESYPDHFADLNDRDIRDRNLPDRNPYGFR